MQFRIRDFLIAISLWAVFAMMSYADKLPSDAEKQLSLQDVPVTELRGE